MNYDAQTIAVIAIVLGVAGTLKGVIGIGLQATAVPLLVMSTNVRETILILAVSLIVLNFWQAFSGGQAVTLLRRFGVFIAAMSAGIWIGTSILFRVDPAGLSTLTGFMVCLYAASELLGLPWRMPRYGERVISSVIGFGAGFIGAISGLFGPIVVTYLASLSLEKEAFIRVTALIFLVVASIWFIALVHSGAMTTIKIGISAVAVVPALAGMFFGQRLRRSISEEKFRRFVLAFLFLIGIRLIWQGLT